MIMTVSDQVGIFPIVILGLRSYKFKDIQQVIMVTWSHRGYEGTVMVSVQEMFGEEEKQRVQVFLGKMCYEGNEGRERERERQGWQGGSDGQLLRLSGVGPINSAKPHVFWLRSVSEMSSICLDVQILSPVQSYLRSFEMTQCPKHNLSMGSLDMIASDYIYSFKI